jgi:lysozyme
MRNVKNIEEQLRLDEGEKLYAYKDSLGFWTIGVGRLIDEKKGGGLTEEESAYLLKNDIARKTNEVKNRLDWFSKLDEVRQAVLINMAFQMGVEGLLKFKNTLTLVKSGYYEDAAKNMLQSLWAQQTPERAKRLAEQMKTGVWQ